MICTTYDVVHLQLPADDHKVFEEHAKYFGRLVVNDYDILVGYD